KVCGNAALGASKHAAAAIEPQTSRTPRSDDVFTEPSFAMSQYGFESVDAQPCARRGRSLGDGRRRENPEEAQRTGIRRTSQIRNASTCVHPFEMTMLRCTLKLVARQRPDALH